MPKTINNELTDKQKRFCEEYVIDNNGTQAAIRAGYSEKTANRIATENLSKLVIKEYVKELQNKLSGNSLDLAERITREWERLAFTSIAHLHNTWIERKELELLTDDQKAAIESIETRVLKRNIGTSEKPDVVDVEQIKVKLFDKTKALTELGKHIGYYGVDNKQKTPVTNIDLTGLTYEQIRELANKEPDKDGGQ